MRFDPISRPQPFLGILLAASGWALSHQIASDAIFDDCARDGTLIVAVSLIGLLVTAAGGLYCLLSWRRADQGRGFVGIVGALLALVAAFAIVLQIAAGLILPACAA